MQTLEEIDSRISELQAEIDELPFWGAAVSFRLEEIWRLTAIRKSISAAAVNDSKKVSEEGPTTELNVSR